MQAVPLTHTLPQLIDDRELDKKDIFIQLIEEVRKGQDPFKFVVRHTKTGEEDELTVGPSCSNPSDALKGGGKRAYDELIQRMNERFENMTGFETGGK